MNRLPAPISPMLKQLLGRLRRQIRWFIWLEALAVLVIWLGALYWLGLALDYLPVWLGAGEMPRGARIALLALIGLGFLWLAYRFLIRRAFTPLPDRHLALLIERRFPELDDALLTVVDNTDPRARSEGVANADPQSSGESLYEALLKRTESLAVERTKSLPLPRLLRWPALTRHLMLALFLVASIVGFAVVNRTAWSLWTARLLLQTDQPWPRRASLEVLDFNQGRRKVAEGADLMIRVRANARLRTPPPEICLIDYRLDSGQQGRANMVREGEPVEGYQYYRYEGPPFQGMLETVEFDVLGLDARVSNLRVDVVPSPSIADVQLDCVFPEYTKLPPRKQPWRAGTSLPAGTKVQLTVTATKSLREALVLDLNTEQRQRITISSSSTNAGTARDSGTTIVAPPESNPDTNAHTFQFTLPPLKETQAVEIELLDQDDVTSQKPYRLAIQVVDDLPPQIALNLQGIGTAITADARLAVSGSLEDDYGVAKNWFQVLRERAEEDSSNKIFPLPLPARDAFEQTLDLRQVRQSDDGWQVEPGDKLVLSVRATDECDLGEKKQEGQSDPWPLDVVSPDELLALLEARELNLKRRFEQILVEMTDTRDSLLRLQASLNQLHSESDPNHDAPVDDAKSSATAQGKSAADEAEASDPEDDSNSSPPTGETDSAATDANQASVLRILRVQRAQQQGAKSQQEVAGVASAFADIREELINNRVDTPERRDRLQRDIIQPLDLIASDQFARWQEQLKQLESRIDQPDADELSTVTLQQTNELIYALQQVLEKMLELETYNELVDLVRSIVDEQNQLLEKTKEERKRQARALLEDE